MRWPIERKWVLLAGERAREQLGSSALLEYRACSLVGAGGLGKTYELEYLAELDRNAGRDVRFERLAVLAQTPDGLVSRLNTLSEGLTKDSVVYLDALDEVMIPVRTAGLIVQVWIRNSIARIIPAIRISYRSAVWPSVVQSALHEVYGKQDCAFALLQPLATEDIKSVASASRLDPDSFVGAVNAVGAGVLSQQPLTLKMLLQVFSARGSLPAGRRDLFAQGVEVLADERAERRDDGTAIEVPTADILDAAERLACYMLLSGRDLVDLGDSPSANAIGRLELERLADGSRRLDDLLVRAVSRCGLCDGDGTRQFRFVHRQFAEYLAGRRIGKLLFHQARSLLSSSMGWQSGVAGPLRETAAFAAMESNDIADWITEHDPELLGLSDVADDVLRRRATLNLLEKFRRHELTDAQVSRREGLELSGLKYRNAEADLRPVLRDRQPGHDDLLECAVKLIDTWEMTSMSDDLADLMLDAGAPLQTRIAAGYTLAKLGTKEARDRLLPLIADRTDDPDREVKGVALRCAWLALSVGELLKALTPEGRPGYGAYGGFLYMLAQEGFSAPGHRVEGLIWAKQVCEATSDSTSMPRIVRHIAIGALDEIDDAAVAEGLAELMLEAARHHTGSDRRWRTWLRG